MKLVLLLWLVVVGKVAAAADDYQVPVFTVQELLHPDDDARTAELLEILGTTGLISVVDDHHETTSFAQTRRDGLLGLCQCSSTTTSSLFQQVNGVDSAVLADGTKRTTLATATVGETPLELPQDIQDACSTKTVHALEQLRDRVAYISHAFVSFLDRQLVLHRAADSNNEKASWLLRSQNNNKAYHSIQSIVRASQNLEHFHVYEKDNNESNHNKDNKVLDVHTDAGLFLAFVPGQQCHSDNDDDHDDSSDFYIQTMDGSLQRAVFAPGAVGVMLGVGAEHWLRHVPAGVPLRATRHAVRMEPGHHKRAWYGMST